MPKQAETAEVGTKESGFAKGEKWGPFDCGHCRHFHASQGEHVCVHPKVIADPDPTLSRRDGEGRPFVSAEDCCRFERKANGTGPEKTDAQRSGMRG